MAPALLAGSMPGCPTRKPPLGKQRRLSLRHRDHQTVMTRATKHDRWKVMTRVRRNG
jgi:hypothetical protein